MKGQFKTLAVGAGAAAGYYAGYAAVAYAGYGRAGSRPTVNAPLASLMPEYEVREVHRLGVAPQQIRDAAKGHSRGRAARGRTGLPAGNNVGRTEMRVMICDFR
jgi:hypothetical protein